MLQMARYLFFEEGSKGEVQKVETFVKQLQNSRFSKRKNLHFTWS